MNNWHWYSKEKPQKAGDYLVRGVGGLDNKFHYWLCFWVPSGNGIIEGFYYNGNEFRNIDEGIDYEWIDVNEL